MFDQAWLANSSFKITVNLIGQNQASKQRRLSTFWETLVPTTSTLVTDAQMQTQ